HATREGVCTMNRGLKDNPLERMKISEFPGTDFNLMGIERVFYETEEPIEDIETEAPVQNDILASDGPNSYDAGLGDKLKRLFSNSG
ncbi:MAG: hypothetical protein ACE5KG_06310, partial [Nitrososphaerales archaeon]